MKLKAEETHYPIVKGVTVLCFTIYYLVGGKVGLMSSG